MPSHTRRLRDLLFGLVTVPAADDREVRALCMDSREVTPGSLFIATAGSRVDGRAYIADACARGAVAVLYDAGGAALAPATVPSFGVPELRRHIGTIADRFYGAPSKDLTVIGVTGTNGKTTCTQLLAQALDRAPRRCAVIGTLGYGFPGELVSGLHTTPDAVTVHRLLDEFRTEGAVYASMEVSSHALDQGRVGAVAFEVAVFTNLTRDHLDYHGDMAAYGAAKARLFAWPGLKTAVVNTDDAFGRDLRASAAGHCRVLTYGLEHGDVHARDWQATPQGLSLHAVTPAGEVRIDSPLLGRFNALNLLAVLAVLIALDIAPNEAAARLSAARPVPGRVERFARDGSPLVVVDYAHTPDALEQVLQALRAHVRGKLWCVFGCGGNRDRGKRPQMGRIAEQLADRVVVTDDNPRDESGDAIVADIVAGMHTRPLVIRDRAEAIAHAVQTAAAIDVILVAGKGHEDYQEVRGVRRAYSDRDTVRAVLGLAA